MDIVKIYEKLLQEWGDPIKYWPLWCAKNKTIADREEITIGTILVQRTTWHNAEIGLKNLKQSGIFSLSAIAHSDNSPITPLIRSAGFFQTKPKRLISLCRWLSDRGGVNYLLNTDLAVARKELLSLSGIGPETADTLLLYVGDQPIFIIDEYTKRFVKKNTLSTDFSYSVLQQLFENNLSQDYRLFQDFHALIIIDCKNGKNSAMGVI